ncbi:Ribose-phosphate pyrophosphokinase 1 [Vitis vinifera]|uniref:ribose-phosphate diphosphokinase n=1 Tax=Vitis vinifera TaxID=29760 RepID=A0A438BX66_VITVI|nr:Ribose-phosphate pyrophosphokinase 1 [Vitis vinifera]
MALSLFHSTSSSIAFSSSSPYSPSSPFAIPFPTHRLSPRNTVRCNLVEPVKFNNGRPFIPVLREPTLPNFLSSKDMEETINKNDTRLRIFSGTANPALSQLEGDLHIITKRGSSKLLGLWRTITSGKMEEIACYMGLELGKINIKRFADGEIYVQLQESVRGCDVYLVQPTCPPANENLMELLIMIDACRRASAKNITAVIPYFGYARADRKTQGRESIAAKLVANLITEAGANRVLACDLHSGQSMGYFDIPVDHVYGQPVILDYLASKTICSDDLIVVSPDVGGVARARAFAKKLSDAPLAIVDKRRHGHNVAEVSTDPPNLLSTTQVMNLIGDVKGKVAVMVDDMIDTAGTIAKGAALLHQEGAREVYACSTHAVFSPPAIQRLSSGLFQEVIITNTIPVLEQNYFPQLTVLSVANLLGETIWRVHDDCSLSLISSNNTSFDPEE